MGVEVMETNAMVSGTITPGSIPLLYVELTLTVNAELTAGGRYVTTPPKLFYAYPKNLYGGSWSVSLILGNSINLTSVKC